MKNRLLHYLDMTFYFIKIFLVVFMVIAGISLAFTAATAPTGALAFIVAHRWILYLVSAAFAGAGLYLGAGMVKQKRNWVSRALMMIFCCFLFGSILQGQAFSWALSYWLPNAIATLVVGLIWLRWRFRISWINLHDFRQETIKLDKYHKL